MAGVRTTLAVVLLGLCVLAGVAHGFVVEQQQDGPDSAWQFSLDGNGVDEPVLAAEQGGHLVGELKDFKIKGFESYDAGVAGSGDVANVNQFSDNTFASDVPEQFSSSDVNSNQFQAQDDQFATQDNSRSGDEGYVYNARLQSRTEFDTNDVAEPDNAGSYDYNRFSALPEGFSAPASQFNRQPSSASYVLGVPEQREEEARPDYAYDARAEGNGVDGTSFSTLDVQDASDDHAVPAKEVGTTSAPAGESLPPYVYDARTGSSGSENEGSAGGASFTTTDSVQQQESSEDEVVPAKGHEGPVSYYTPASDRNGAFVFYDPRSDEEKKLGSKVDDSAGAASLAKTDTTTSASTTPVQGTPKATEGTHGCPNSYWAQHVDQWPAQLKITTLVSQAFGAYAVKKNLEIVYGTTTVFQALLDSRDDPYSKLLRHAVAALLNAYAKTAYTLRPAEVAQLFNSALVSRTTAAAQAQKFENENHAFGANECK
ncbi:hypothetical protein M758_8G139700 [Ceratodon purpureus]|nr:hypothetical protein M758_8G139700 [Ceratodon purpureus]